MDGRGVACDDESPKYKQQPQPPPVAATIALGTLQPQVKLEARQHATLAQCPAPRPIAHTQTVTDSVTLHTHIARKTCYQHLEPA
jgi:hypothetical protein